MKTLVDLIIICVAMQKVRKDNGPEIGKLGIL